MGSTRRAIKMAGRPDKMDRCWNAAADASLVSALTTRDRGTPRPWSGGRWADRDRSGARGSGSWVAFLIRHCLAGMLAGSTTVGGLLWLNVASLGSLVISSDLLALPLLMMPASFGLTFGGVAVASTIMGLGAAAMRQRSHATGSGP